MINNLFITILSVSVYFVIFSFRKKISLLLNVVDVPNEARKIHKIATPKTASFSIVLFFFFYLYLIYLTIILIMNLTLY